MKEFRKVLEQVVTGQNENADLQVDPYVDWLAVRLSQHQVKVIMIEMGFLSVTTTQEQVKLLSS